LIVDIGRQETPDKHKPGIAGIAGIRHSEKIRNDGISSDLLTVDYLTVNCLAADPAFFGNVNVSTPSSYLASA
jgi:hypothetical protein